ncbi:hypothetical protein L1887_33480 [Cichorium endivia]|nr:hypothetical protein L1887_33480 [Cichorium endivia]
MFVILEIKLNLEKSTILPLSGKDSPSVIDTTPYGSAHVAHGSKITSFDWSLRRKSTILTPFTAIDSLLLFSSNVVAAGATRIDYMSRYVYKNKERMLNKGVRLTQAKVEDLDLPDFEVVDKGVEVQDKDATDGTQSEDNFDKRSVSSEVVKEIVQDQAHLNRFQR